MRSRFFAVTLMVLALLMTACTSAATTPTYEQATGEGFVPDVRYHQARLLYNIHAGQRTIWNSGRVSDSRLWIQNPYLRSPMGPIPYYKVDEHGMMTRVLAGPEAAAAGEIVATEDEIERELTPFTIDMGNPRPAPAAFPIGQMGDGEEADEADAEEADEADAEEADERPTRE
ncbi:MAG: hypothetical protein HC884_13615, partial [Chloroflexaceae bacterium]|nr:hypothetical protein [Chloroflexaceae bacterium]